MTAWISIVMAVLAVGGQLANLFLNLKLGSSILQSEEKVLAKVDLTYKRKDVCAAEMQAVIHGPPRSQGHGPLQASGNGWE
jgi:hypothetical protein